MLERSRHWTQADLESLIRDAVQESIGLDYKAGAALGRQDRRKADIGKDVSAFANSGGGVIVYGMTENADHMPQALDPVDARELSKEWLENVILSNVQPRIEEVHINPIVTAANRCIYVVTIPQSFTAHQAPDHRYYRRFNFQSVPMEDYEVRDAMNRGRTPIIDVWITSNRQVVDRDVHNYDFQITLQNKGAVAARNMKVILGFPSQLMPDTQQLRHGPEIVEEGAGGEYRARQFYREIHDQIIFPADSFILNGAAISFRFTLDRQRFEYVQRLGPYFTWTVYADDMAPRKGRVKISGLIDY